MAKNTSKAIALESANYVRIAEVDNKEVKLYARPVDATEFPNCQLYSLPATRGSVKGELQYFVTVDDYEQHKPKRTRASISRDAIVETLMQSMGIDKAQAEELHSKMQENVLAKKSNK